MSSVGVVWFMCVRVCVGGGLSLTLPCAAGHRQSSSQCVILIGAFLEPAFCLFRLSLSLSYLLSLCLALSFSLPLPLSLSFSLFLSLSLSFSLSLSLGRYWCINPESPTGLNTFVERPAIQARLLFWLAVRCHPCLPCTATCHPSPPARVARRMCPSHSLPPAVANKARINCFKKHTTGTFPIKSSIV